MKPRKSATGFTDGRTLGSELRARRLGFGWIPEIGCYVRVSDELIGGACIDGYRVDVVGPEGPASSRATPKLPKDYRCWWEGDVSLRADIADMIVRVVAGGHRLTRVRCQLAFVMVTDTDEFDHWVTVRT